MAERKRPSQPMTEEQLRLSVVGELKPDDAPITLVEYDPAWPKIFVREATRIKAALGARAIVVEHVGSTSMPGLIATAIFDMLIVLAESLDQPAYVPTL